MSNQLNTLDEFDLDDLDELESAEDFLDYFGIAYDAAVVQVNRLHILQRFHDYLAEVETMPTQAQARFDLHRDLLQGAYRDFVRSDAQTEKVFKVFKQHQPVTVGLDSLLGQLPHAPAV
ncbi:MULTISPECIES: nitrogenase-stabilizing/protective protein NifW [Thiorhodovibrio]|jgi:nitrogenase-stabilizing/protective protein|uniref:nitrogenase-stabilizing/protective protein NifW n=1 Tax=Thiorhodovibrio TaxID=61593 RepID=UPI0019138D94|nr:MULTISPECIES: nitrogenase-stabilizing/protective protein NifW [Thiorhodovibrio]MBK5970339.1 nitrogen fixation protein NifW [Thiorhodovibrio winogradskyi]WPL13695.1 Nitrogenase-stabilizing/protective protein NifW [Thiorhodovibrio litoralis]